MALEGVHVQASMVLHCYGRNLKMPERSWPNSKMGFILPFRNISLKGKNDNRCKRGSYLHHETKCQYRHEEVLTRRILLSILRAVLFDPVLLDCARADDGNRFPVYALGRVPIEIVMQGSPFTARVLRPRNSIQSDDELEEVLTAKLRVRRQKASAFHVFVNLPTANEETPLTCSEFAGVFYHEPRRVKNRSLEFQGISYRIGITDVIRDLGLVDQPDILVTFVPTGIDKGEPVVIEDLYMTLE